jgi:hypothetical protein
MTVSPRLVAAAVLCGWIISPCFGPASRGAESLKLDPANPHYLVFRGRPIVLVASTG